MRNIQFIIFFSIVLSVYSLLSYYIYSKGIQAFPFDSSGRNWFKFLFIFLTASYIIARVMERVYLSVLSDVFTWIGSFWLAAFFYFLLISVTIDLIRMANAIVPFIPQEWKAIRFKQLLFLGSTSIVAITLLIGFINALSPRVKTIDINIAKRVNGLDHLDIAFVSDIHMGTLVGPRRTRKIMDKINGLNPDLILLGGDIVDEDLGPVIRGDLGSSLKKLTAPLGVIGITGNHEYIGGAKQAVNYLEEHGITMVRDTFLTIQDEIYIVGREDRDRPRFAGQGRKHVSEILKGVDLNKPVIMLDHQPFDLDEKEKAGVDLTLSGHTHHGQIWPLNYITKTIYEVSWGYKLKGNMHVYVSSGVGGWGPPVRLGNRPEIVRMRIAFSG